MKFKLVFKKPFSEICEYIDLDKIYIQIERDSNLTYTEKMPVEIFLSSLRQEIFNLQQRLKKLEKKNMSARKKGRI
jgi:hypothetical protein